ncbi:speckle-type POZ protein-like [Planococcus citri]|uniref:speckle-type POZ protein-like n=1 Tax=Planococcus citri TaxID=170843 RepID=UPI0031F8182A
MNKSSDSITLPTKTKTSIPDWHCITYGEWQKTSQLWTIKGFREFHCKVNKSLRSSEFVNPGDPQYKWRLTIMTNNQNLEDEDYIGLFLNLDRHSVEAFHLKDIFVNMTMCLRDVEGNEVLGRQTQAEFTLTNKQHGYPYFVTKKALFDPDPNNKLLIEDTLTVFCEFEYTEMGVNDYFPSQGPEVKVTVPDNVLKGLERLLRDQTFVDVTFVVDGKNFGAHKNILASRCPVFEAMFKHNMQENKSNEVNISDIRPEVFEEFLLFMYTDKTPNYKLVTELLVVADKYQVEGLRVLCEEIISKELTVENAFDLLFFADLHGAERLLSKVAFYIKTNPANLTATQSWKNAILTHPHLFDLVNGICDVQTPFISSKLQVPSLSNTSIQRKRKR